MLVCVVGVLLTQLSRVAGPCTYPSGTKENLNIFESSNSQRIVQRSMMTLGLEAPIAKPVRRFFFCLSK